MAGFCSKCGAPRDDGASFCAACGAAFGPPAVSRDSAASTTYSTRPGELVLVALLLAACGVLVCVAAGIACYDAAQLFPNGSFGRAFAILFLVFAAIFGTVGVGLLLVSLLINKGDRVGQYLGVAFCAAVILAVAASPARTTADWVAFACAIGAGLILLVFPRVTRYFAERDARPAGVVGAVAALDLFVWNFALAGVSCFALASFESKFVAYGILLLAGSAVLLAVTRTIRKGSSGGRAVASLLLIGLAIVMVLAQRSTGSWVLCGIAGSAILMLWLPTSSNAFFNSPSELPPDAWRVWPWTTHRRNPAPGLGFGLLGLAAVIGLVVWGTTGSSNNFDSLGDNYYGSTVPFGGVTGVPTSTIEAGPLSQSWTISATAQGGYSMTAQLQVGQPQPYQTGIANGSAVAGSSCSLSTQTDAVVPAEMTLTNTTSDFEATPDVQIEGIGSQSIPNDQGPGLSWEADYSTGAVCNGQSDGSSSFSMYSSNLAAGQSSTAYAFFDITDFYTPDNPTSNPTVFGDTVLTVPTSFSVTPTGPTGNTGSGQTVNWTVTGVTGPGVVGNSSDGWSFTLAGTPPPSSNTGTTGDGGTGVTG